LGKSDPKSAIRVLEEASAFAPAKSTVQENLKALLGVAYFQAGNVEAEKGRLAEAADHADKAIGLVPADLNAYALKANACVQLKQFRRAADALEKMASLQPDNPTIYLSLGDVLYQDGDAQQANRQWQKALQFVAGADGELRKALRERLDGRITEETFK
jgi:tetratricopeptide (TPR) repeat protein